MARTPKPWWIRWPPDVWPISRSVEIAKSIVAGAPAWTQYHGRVRDDTTALNTSGGWLSNLDANPASPIGTGTSNRFRIRFLIDEYNDKTASTTPQLECNYDSGGWFDVTQYTGLVKVTASSQYTDGDGCTTQLLTGSNPTGAFEAVGYADEVDGATPTSTITVKNDFFECEFCVYFVDADVADGKTCQFRVKGLDAYTYAGPTITITKATAVQVSATDGIKAGDTAAAPSLVMQATGTDGVKAGDTAANPTFWWNVAGTDGVELGDTGLGGLRVDVSAADGVDAGDTAAAVLAKVVSGTDGVSVGDTASILATYQIAGTDGVEAGDTAAASLVMPALGTDGVDLGDTAAHTLTLQTAGTDGVSLGDTAVAGLLVLVTATDGVDLGDSAAVTVVAAPVLVSASDGVDLGDTASAVIVHAVAASDGVGLGDTAASSLVLPALGTDGVQVGDTAAVNLVMQVLGLDGVELGDIASSQLIYQVAATDGVTLGDSALGAVVGAILAEATDGLTLGDVATVVIVLPSLIPEHPHPLLVALDNFIRQVSLDSSKRSVEIDPEGQDTD